MRERAVRRDWQKLSVNTSCKTFFFQATHEEAVQPPKKMGRPKAPREPIFIEGGCADLQVIGKPNFNCHQEQEKWESSRNLEITQKKPFWVLF